MTGLLRARRVRGAALVELLFVVPVLLIMVTAILSLSRLIWQLQLLSDAAKYGARMATFQTDTRDMTCSEVLNSAVTAAEEYRERNENYWQLGQIWDVTSAMTPTYPFPGMRMRMVKVVYGPKASITENCLFCAYGFLRMLSPNTPATMDLSFDSVTCMPGVVDPSAMCP